MASYRSSQLLVIALVAAFYAAVAAVNKFAGTSVSASNPSQHNDQGGKAIGKPRQKLFDLRESGGEGIKKLQN